MSKQTIYISGPMRGYPCFNFPAFDKARDNLIAAGYEVISPADIDRNNGFDETKLPEDHDWNDIESIGFDLMTAIDRDIEAIKKCDTIYMLRGWENSTGAKAELAMAEWMGKRIIYQAVPVMEETPDADKPKALRYNDGKPEWSLVDFDSLLPMVDVLTYGATKYTRNNWQKGFPIHSLFDSLLRHVFAMLNGQLNDAESGCGHIGHIQSNAMFIAHTLKHHPEFHTIEFNEKDDQQEGEGEPVETEKQKEPQTGDRIIMIKDGGTFFRIGDYAVLTNKDSDYHWWADFTENASYHGDGSWCVGEGDKFRVINKKEPEQ